MQIRRTSQGDVQHPNIGVGGIAVRVLVQPAGRRWVRNAADAVATVTGLEGEAGRDTPSDQAVADGETCLQRFLFRRRLHVEDFGTSSKGRGVRLGSYK